MKKLLALFLILALSIPSALAVTEGKIEDAPDVDVSITIENAQTGYYLPDASYFESEYEDAPEWAKSKTYVTTAYNEEAEMYPGTSNPFLTPGEIERANILKKDYEA